MSGFIKQYGRLILGRGGSAALQAVTLVVLARFSSIEEFGVYATGVAAGAICIGVFGMGLPTLVLRTEAREVTGLAGSALIIGAVGAGTATFSVFVTLLAIAPEAGLSIAVAAATFSGSELWLNLVQNVLLGSHREVAATSIIVVRRAVPLLVVLLFVPNGGGVYLGLTVGSSIMLFIGMTVVWPARRRKRSVAVVWEQTRHFWLANVGSMLQQLDVVIIRQGLGNAPAAAYSAAFRLASPVHIVTTAITSKMVPALAAEANPITRAARQRRYVLTGVGYAGVVLLISPLAAVAGPFLLGEQYQAWAWVFPLTLVNSALSVVNQIQAAVLYADGRSKGVARATLIAVLTGLVVVALATFAGSFGFAIGGTILIQVILVGTLAWMAKADRE